MSKQIDLNKKLSPEDREWLESRSMREDIELNDRRFGEDGSGPDSEVEEKDDEDGVEVSEEIYNHVSNLDFNELRTELAKYNLPAEGDDIKGMKTMLAVHLQELEDLREADRNAPAKARAEHEADPTK